MSHARRNPAISEGLLKGVGANERAVRYTLGELKRIVTKGFKYMRGLIVDYVGVLDGTEEDNRRWKALLAAAKANGAATAILSNDPGADQARSTSASGSTAETSTQSFFPERWGRKSLRSLLFRRPQML